MIDIQKFREQGFIYDSIENYSKFINFDDIINTSAGIPSGYNSYTWNNFGVANGNNNPNTGYQVGIVSEANVAFNSLGSPAYISKSNFFKQSITIITYKYLI